MGSGLFWEIQLHEDVVRTGDEDLADAASGHHAAVLLAVHGADASVELFIAIWIAEVGQVMEGSRVVSDFSSVPMRWMIGCSSI